MPDVKRWWISWEEPADADEGVDIVCQGDTGIHAAWCTGWLGDGSAANVCAIVDAENENEAKAIVAGSYMPREWRFCEEKEPGWVPPSDRFPA